MNTERAHRLRRALACAVAALPFALAAACGDSGDSGITPRGPCEAGRDCSGCQGCLETCQCQMGGPGCASLCGGAPDAQSGTGGTAGAGGAAGSGGVGPTGGAGAGGFSGGGGVGTGGIGTGGGGSVGPWDSVRCWEYQGTMGVDYICAGIDGDTWDRVYPSCLPDGYAGKGIALLGEPRLHLCGAGPDSTSGWDEIRCWDFGSNVLWCFGRLGNWWTQLGADCDGAIGGGGPGITPAPPDPSLAYCGTQGDTGSLDEVKCWQYSSTTGPYCYGRRGAYWTQIYATCDFDTYTTNPGYREVDPASVTCR